MTNLQKHQTSILNSSRDVQVYQFQVLKFLRVIQILLLILSGMDLQL